MPVTTIGPVVFDNYQWRNIMSKEDQYTITITPKHPRMNKHCYQISEPKVPIPSKVNISFDKCIIKQAEEIFEKYPNLRSFVFDVTINNTSIAGELTDGYIEFHRCGSHRSAYLVFNSKKTKIKYQIDFTCYIEELVDKELEKKAKAAKVDKSDISLFVDTEFDKCLCVDLDHLKPDEFAKLLYQVEEFNLTRDRLLTLFVISPAYEDDDPQGLGAILHKTPWNEVDVKSTCLKDYKTVKKYFDDLKLPEHFSNIIWKAGYAGADTVIFIKGGRVYDELPEFSDEK